jgi:hypothetical protein
LSNTGYSYKRTNKPKKERKKYWLLLKTNEQMNERTNKPKKKRKKERREKEIRDSGERKRKRKRKKEIQKSVFFLI